MSNELKYSTGSYTYIPPKTQTIYAPTTSNETTKSNIVWDSYEYDYKPFSYSYCDFFKPAESKKENEYVVDLI